MSVRRSPVSRSWRADQHPDLPLPQLPESDGIAVLCPRAVRPAIEAAGDTGRYGSSERLDRVFCTTCGSSLFSWRRDGTAAGIALAAFDDRNAFAPTEHIWVSEKIDWVTLDDGLTQYSHGVPQ